jgi:ankyrin repeat protein
LEIAIEYRKTRIVKLLLEAGASLEGSGDRPILTLALWQNHLPVTKLLLDAGADVNYTHKNFYPHLTTAVEHGNRHTLSLLLEAGADPNPNTKFYSNLPLARAFSHGNEAKIRLLLKAGATINQQCEDGDSVFCVLSDPKHRYQMALYALECGAIYHKNATGESPLSQAIKEGWNEMIDLYWDLHHKTYPHKAEIDELFTLALEHRNLPPAHRFAGLGAAARKDTLDRLLHSTAQMSQASWSRYLVSLGAVESVGEDGKLPSERLDLGADEYEIHLEVLTSGYPAVLRVMRSGSVSESNTAIRGASDLSVTDPHGRGILHLAVRMGRLSLVKTAIKKGVDLDMVDRDGNTALHHALILRDYKPRFGKSDPNLVATYEKIAGHLISAGARADIANSDGMSAAMMEMRAKQPQLFAG